MVEVSGMGDFSIQISAELVNRLADDGEKLEKKPKKTKTKIPRQTVHPQTKVNKKHLHADPEIQRGFTSAGWSVQPPFFSLLTPHAHSANTELDAIRSLVQDGERVVEKLQKQEESMVQEVTERAKDLRDKEFKLPYQEPMPCLAEYDACQLCYKEHGNDTLKCSPLTQSFYDCARRAKQQVSSVDN